MEVNRHFLREEEPRSLGITVRKPKHPQFADITKRHDSFSTWPQYLPMSADELAECGFVYTGVDDSVRCYHCGGVLKSWEAGDDPWMEHVTWYPDCPHVPHVLLSKGQRFIDRTRNDGGGLTEDEHQLDVYLETVAAKSCLQTGYSVDSVRRAIDKCINEFGKSNFTGRDICLILLAEEDKQDTSRESSNAFGSLQASTQSLYPVPKTSGETPNDSFNNGDVSVTRHEYQPHCCLETIAAQGCLQMGYSEDSVRRAIEKYINVRGNSNFKGGDICLILLDEDEEEVTSRESSNAFGTLQASTQILFPVPETSGETRNDSLEYQPDGHLETIAAQGCLQMGYSEDSVRRAIEKYISVQGHSYFKGHELCRIIMDEEEEKENY